jgi:hypothetical protein
VTETLAKILEKHCKHTQHLDKTLATYVWKHMQHPNKLARYIRLEKQMKNWERNLTTYMTTITTYAASRSTFATFIWNACNIPLKHLKHLKQTLATYAFKHNTWTK